MLIALAAGLMLLAQAAPPTASPAANTVSGVVVPKPQQPKAEKLVCETTTDTGSFIPKKVCRTRKRSRPCA